VAVRFRFCFRSISAGSRRTSLRERAGILPVRFRLVSLPVLLPLGFRLAFGRDGDPRGSSDSAWYGGRAARAAVRHGSAKGRLWRAPFAYPLHIAFFPCRPTRLEQSAANAELAATMPDELTPEREDVREEHRSITRSLTDVAIVATPIAIVAQPVVAAWANQHFGQGDKPGDTNITVNEAPPQEPEK
jgi:hypothetical protein